MDTVVYVVAVMSKPEQNVTGFSGWLGEDDQIVGRVDDAFIFSKAGALNVVRETTALLAQAYSYNTKTWKLRRVNA